jgi:hypothetical protein
MPCMLDNFPWELLHTIFDFLEVIDLLRAFVDVSPYLNTIFNSYSRIQLNFKSMKKSTFYFICENIHPDQIQSLVLSDGEHTPGQIKLFMSLQPLIQFINLQYISIYNASDVNLLGLMLSHLENHLQIRSLSIDGYSMAIGKTRSRSITQILTSLPSLKYLTFMDSSPLTTFRQPLTELTHLTISSCALDDLRIILHWVPNLVYLQTSGRIADHGTTFDDVPPHLSSLIIKSQTWTRFNELKNLVPFTSSLKRLKLEIMGEQDLLNARLWESLIKTQLPHLTEIALNITPEENNMTGDDVLKPFQNNFWTTEKHCHMACMISTTSMSCVRLFSVPHFSQKSDWYPPGEAFLNYSLTPYSFNDDCTELRVYSSEIVIPSPFKHIQTLSLENAINNIDQLQKGVNLLSANHLKLGPSIQYILLENLFQVAPNISQLSMNRRTFSRIMDSFPDNEKAHEQIKKLTVQDIVSDTDIDKICHMFPKVEYVSLSVRELEGTFRILSGLHYLTSATLHWVCSSKKHLPIMAEYLKQNGICTDDTYSLHSCLLQVWID